MYFSCISDEHTYMDLPSIFSDKYCRYIARMYMRVLFEISINLHFIYIRWIYSHGSAKYICQQILYVYFMYILPRTFWNIHKCNFHVCSMNIHTWICQVYLLADIVCILYVYFPAHFEISINVLFMYIRWIYVHESGKYICWQTYIYIVQGHRKVSDPPNIFS